MKIILIEGTDGTGKSSLVRRLKFLKPSATFLKFPTRYPLYETFSSKEEEIRFYMEDFRAEIQKLRGVEFLVCDRSFLSTMAYQGIDPKILLEGFEIFFPEPEQIQLYLVRLVCDVEIALERTYSRMKEGDALDEIDRLDRESKRVALENLNDIYEEVFAAVIGKAKTLPFRYFKSILLDSSNTGTDEIVSQLKDALSE